jgi:hypothetical protein
VDDLDRAITFSGKETLVIVGRLAAIEAQQRVHTQMLHTLLRALQQQEQLEACDLPEGIHLPLETLDDLRRIERKLNDTETKTLVVCTYKVCALEI